VTTYNLIGLLQRNVVDQTDLVTSSLSLSLAVSQKYQSVSTYVRCYTPSRVPGMTEGATGPAKGLYKRFVARARV